MAVGILTDYSFLLNDLFYPAAIPALRELLPSSYPEFWQSQNSGMKGKVATARIELAIPHLEGFFCENYIFNILYYYIFQCVIIQRVAMMY